MSLGSRVYRLELNTKRLEILKDAVPKLARVGLLRIRRARPPTERAQGCGSGTEAKIGGDRDSTRRQRFRERLSNRKAEAGQRDYDDIATRAFSPKESGSSSLPANTGCRLFTSRRSLSMKAGSCPTGWTTMICSVGRPTTWTRSSKERNRPICRCSRQRSLSL